VRLISTATLRPNSLSPSERFQVYNGMDSAITYEILSALPRRTDNLTYTYEIGLQAPLLEMMMRGVLVDAEARAAARDIVAKRVYDLETLLDFFGEFCGLKLRKMAASAARKRLAYGDYIPKHLNARSGTQLKSFFYDFLNIPAIKSYSAGEISEAMDEDVLEKLAQYSLARPVAFLVLEIRRLQEELKRLRSKISADGRAHTTFGIAGTKTWRLNSSGWTDGTLQNLQNVAPEVRHIYVADPGWKFGSIDSAQAESRMVGWEIGTEYEAIRAANPKAPDFPCWRYLDFGETKDIHSHLCRLAWPQLAWTGDVEADKKYAKTFGLKGEDLVPIESLPDGALNIREKFKKVVHGSNYDGKAETVSVEAQLPLKEVVRARDIYFSEFPEIRQWQNYKKQRVISGLPIINPFGAARHFLGRPKDPKTHREAIAQGPQSGVAMLTNIGIYRIWKNLGHRVRLLLQVHDNTVFMFREDDDEQEVLSLALKWFEVPLRCAGRTMIIPGEAYTGYCWGYYDKKSGRNPRGLRPWFKLD
jgi:DNA polymerase family A